MKLTITARHFEATEALKAHIEQLLSDIERFYNKLIGATVVLSIEKYRNKAEFILESKQKKFIAEAITNDMYHSVEDCAQKLKIQLSRFNEKQKTRRGRKPEKEYIENTESS